MNPTGPARPAPSLQKLFLRESDRSGSARPEPKSTPNCCPTLLPVIWATFRSKHSMGHTTADRSNCPVRGATANAKCHRGRRQRRKPLDPAVPVRPCVNHRTKILTNSIFERGRKGPGIRPPLPPTRLDLPGPGLILSFFSVQKTSKTFVGVLKKRFWQVSLSRAFLGQNAPNIAFY